MSILQHLHNKIQVLVHQIARLQFQQNEIENHAHNSNSRTMK